MLYCLSQTAESIHTEKLEGLLVNDLVHFLITEVKSHGFAVQTTLRPQRSSHVLVSISVVLTLWNLINDLSMNVRVLYAPQI